MCADHGVVWFLNLVLSYVFPCIPWELFFFVPWTFAIMAHCVAKNPKGTVGTIGHLILFLTLFAGVYGGLAHPLGLIQAFDTLGGGDGICVVHPPPMGAVPFKLYYGYNRHPWCNLLALHVIFVSLVGWWFLFQLCSDRAAARKAGWLIMRPDAEARLLYKRCAVWFTVVGLSQAAPYFGAIYAIDDEKGGYSKRPFTPALVENAAAWSWILGGLYFTIRWSCSSTYAVSTAPEADKVQEIT
uniref:Uncharacterized protein n=1 Tax=Alexandrium catenella TaxID=2925 RepID=A0A7S1REM8_ALECA